MPILGVISSHVYPFIYVALALVVAFLGRRRRLGFWGYFFGSILLTPVIGIVLVCATDPKTRRVKIVE